MTLEDSGIPDRRLELMLVCAHPAIAASIRTPLMLQVVLGVDAAAIAAAFAVEPATMAQRLVRAKKRIRATGIPFEMPEREQLAERLPAVLEAVYGAYAIDWQLVPQGSAVESLSAEAVHLALVLADLLPEEPEVLGLAALVCLSEARRPARRADDGCIVPLEEQDTDRWDRTMIDRGEALLTRAYAHHRPGRFQYEAAIQSAHCSRAARGPVDAETLRTLHRALVRTAPSLGARSPLPRSTARSTALRRGCAPSMPLPTPPSNGSSRRWRYGRISLRRRDASTTASRSYRRAIEATSDPGVVEYLERRLRALTS